MDNKQKTPLQASDVSLLGQATQAQPETPPTPAEATRRAWADHSRLVPADASSLDELGWLADQRVILEADFYEAVSAPEFTAAIVAAAQKTLPQQHAAGVVLVVNELRRQLEVLGFDATDPAAAHFYELGQLPDAAVQYIGGDLVACWPDNWGTTYKPTTRVRDLVKAAAMTIQEVSRLLSLGEPVKLLAATRAPGKTQEEQP